MIDLSNITTNLELSKRLKELGISQESIFYWYKGLNNHYIDSYIQGCIHQDYPNSDKSYSAFTSDELLRIIPDRIDIKRGEPFNHFRIDISMSNIVKGDILLLPLNLTRVYRINYHCDTVTIGYTNSLHNQTLFSTPIFDESPANALAKCIIYLRENNLWQ